MSLNFGIYPGKIVNGKKVNVTISTNKCYRQTVQFI
jgi:hypothetical protein